MKYKKRRQSNKVLTALLGISVAALAVLISFFAFQVDDYEVLGNYHETDNEIIESLMEGTWGHNAVYLTLTNRDRKVAGSSFIDTITVNMKSPRSIEVAVKEKELVGYVYFDDHYWYFDRTGMVQALSKYSQADFNLMAEGGIPALLTTVENEITASSASDAPNPSAQQEDSADEPPAAGTSPAAEVGEGGLAAEDISGETDGSGETAQSGGEALSGEGLSEEPDDSGETDGDGQSEEYDSEEDGDSPEPNGEGTSDDDQEEVIAPQEIAAAGFIGRILPSVYMEGAGAADSGEEIITFENDGTDVIVPVVIEDDADAPDMTEPDMREEIQEELQEETREEAQEETQAETQAEMQEETQAETQEETQEKEAEEETAGADQEETQPFAGSDRSTEEDMLRSEGGEVLVYIPFIEGLSFSRIEVGQTVPGQSSRLFDMLDTFRDYVLRTGNIPDRISVGKNQDLSVFYGGAEVRLGTGEKLEVRLNELRFIDPYLEELTGVLHLENFDGSQNEVIFSKK